jgi:hypothetical protein
LITAVTASLGLSKGSAAMAARILRIYRMSNQLNQSGTMTPDEARNFAQRMKGLLRKAEQVE